MLRLTPQGLNELPDVHLYELCTYLTPEEAVLVVRVNKRFRRIALTSFVWREKYKRRFIDCDDAFISLQPIHWYAAFRKAYDLEYKGLSAAERRLFSAVREGAVEHLKKEKITLWDFDKRDATKKSLLARAQDSGSQEVLNFIYELALQMYRDTIESGMCKGRTILFWALSCRQNPDVVMDLLARGSRRNEWYVNGLRPIHIAAWLGCLGSVQFLIEGDQNLLNQTDNFNQTPLVLASSAGHLPVVEYLLDKRAKLDVASFNYGDNFLVDGTPIDLSECEGRTALHWVADNRSKKDKGCSQVFTALVQAGAKSIATTHRARMHPIHLAARNGHLAMVRSCIEKWPELLNQVDRFGQSPLIWAVSKRHFPVVEYLIKQGASLEAVSSGFTHSNTLLFNNRTALHWAAEKEDGKAVASLLDAGASRMAASGPMRLQPIHLAAKEGSLEVVTILIEKHPDLLNQVDAGGQTALMWAASKGHFPVVEYLLRKGADLTASSKNFRNKQQWRNGYTALDWAVVGGHNKIVKALLDEGLVPSLRTRVHQSKLNKQVKAELELFQYIQEKNILELRRAHQYETSFSLFGHDFNFGCSRTEKLNAARALARVIHEGEDCSTLTTHEKALKNGNLGSIYHRLRPSLR